MSASEADERLRAHQARLISPRLVSCGADCSTLSSEPWKSYRGFSQRLSCGRTLDFWAIYNDHIDVPLRDHLSETLIPSVACELNEVYSTEPLPDAESLRQAIRRGFGTENNSRMATLLRPRQELPQHTAPDSQITPAAAPLSGAKQAQEEISHKAIELHTAPPPQFPGATRDSKKEPTRRCALLLVYGHQDCVLHVASTGNCRAVLGRRSRRRGESWTTTVIPVDQHCVNTAEQMHANFVHPGGSGPKNLPRAHNSDDDARTIPRPTILQLTPEPLVTSVEIEPESGDFVVMAASGRLWECLSAAEVVALVGRWIDEPENIGTEEGRQGWSKYIKLVGLRTVSNRVLTCQGKLSQRTLNLASPDERFVMEDGNAASHLIRNALGGRLQSQPLSAWFRFSLLRGRGYPADMTASVVFFGGRPRDVGARIRGLAELAVGCRGLIARLLVDIAMRCAEFAQVLALELSPSSRVSFPDRLIVRYTNGGFALDAEWPSYIHADETGYARLYVPAPIEVVHTTRFSLVQ
ncbi:uncharacterized protein BO95DRAFT_482097 [Aspergillus brunneoviolaceus CBS 621.78]|uniref:Uncharacterized protein n=1 Tax=Aspergillus brunneoviolaceus CBS 621.78 TaxID=1450534 RepID=A0ACD1G991_9EURO|nr:hypothetical protein BO95DRAFT_482097 [Aspergillus brunneoviolaceus CBS 621.78]RAH45818.1 hypothetical protein BO95DRAFT_482097 [Aspergillus brunneoviolaceus CBS 621.78]